MRLTKLFVLACGITLSHAAWAQQKYFYLHEATNAIFQIQSGTVQPKAEEVAKIAAIGCNALERLLKDDDFQADLKKLAAGVNANEAYHAALRRDIRQFTDSFLQLEIRQLKDAKISDVAAKQILSAAGFLKESIGRKPDIEKLLADVGTLRNDLCMAARTMQKEVEDAKAQTERRERLKSWGLGLGGLTLIAVDIPLLAPSAGVATASFALGGTMLGAGIAR